MPGPQRPEKVINNTQEESHQKSGQKPPGSKHRHRHPRNRRQLKPCRGSS